MEAKKLESFEGILHKARYVAAISNADVAQLSERYKNVHHILPFTTTAIIFIKLLWTSFFCPIWFPHDS